MFGINKKEGVNKMENSVDYINLGKRVKFYRKKADITQDQLGVLIGISQKHISNIECAVSVPTIKTIVKICNSLHITPNQLLMESIKFDYPERFSEIASMIENCSLEQLADITNYIHFTMQKSN